jgi:hypothetical protein
VSARRPGRGQVGQIDPVTGGSGAPTDIAAARAQRRHDGTWRPDKPYENDNGLRITMRRAPGITDPDVLKVPMRFQAPIVGDLVRQFGFNWATYDTLRLGQRARPMGRQLLELPISTMLLDGHAQWASRGIVVWPHAPEPLKVIDELKYIAGMVPGSRATPFRLTITQPSVWGSDVVVNMLAVLTRVSATQKAGQVGTEYLDATFLESDEDETSRRRQPRDDEKTRYHDFDPADSLSLHGLARRYYHRPSAAKYVATANGIKGVSASSEAGLARWMTLHHRKRLRIPPKPRTWGRD